MVEFQSISILFTNKCNIDCEHCLISAGPQNKGLFDISNMDNIINGMNEVGIRVVGITGGEPLLFKRYLKEICFKFKESGIRSMIATNAFWASTYKDADNLVGDMNKWGVRNLQISFDEYHQKRIPPQNVFYAVKAALKHNIRYNVRVSALNFEVANRMYKSLTEMSIHNVSLSPVEIAGKAKNLDLKSIKGVNMSVPSCNLVTNPIVLLNGDVIACCDLLIAPEYNPDIKSPLHLGNIYNDELRDILIKGAKNPYLDLLQIYGPDAMYQKLVKMSSDFDIKESIVKDVNCEGCKLCYWLLNDEKRAKKVLSCYFNSNSSCTVE
jgi:MoaA/NifB/PqqE/SkfB family radical SAM enzyme